MKNFQQTQLELANYLRSPRKSPPPAHVEQRRLDIYRDLIYNNIENFIANVFPVTRSLLTDDHWHELVRGFIEKHYCQTPYFLQISNEFVQYMLQERGLHAGDPPYLLELIHYEWIELVLDVDTATIPAAGNLPADIYRSRPRISPLAVCLSYQFPLQKISNAQQQWQPHATQLLVYRNRSDKVCFMEANALTARLVFLLQSSDEILATHVTRIAAELQYEDSKYDELKLLKKQAISCVESLFNSHVISHFE